MPAGHSPWNCALNVSDATRRSCEAPEEAWDNELVTQTEGFTLQIAPNSLSGYVGVKRLGHGRFETRCYDGRHSHGFISLGIFHTAVEAAVARAKHVATAWQRVVGEEHEGTISKRELDVASKEALLAKREALLAKREAALAAREAAAAEQQTRVQNELEAVRDREARAATRELALASREMALKCMIAERKSAMTEREKAADTAAKALATQEAALHVRKRSRDADQEAMRWASFDRDGERNKW